MSKRSDDSIERIFRQVLTQFDTTFNESDWMKMEKMLNDEADRKAALRSKKIKGIAYSLIGLAGLITTVYFLAFNNPSESTTRSNDSETEMQALDELGKNGNVKPRNPSAGLLSESEDARRETQMKTDPIVAEEVEKINRINDKASAPSKQENKNPVNRIVTPSDVTALAEKKMPGHSASGNDKVTGNEITVKQTLPETGSEQGLKPAQRQKSGNNSNGLTDNSQGNETDIALGNEMHSETAQFSSKDNLPGEDTRRLGEPLAGRDSVQTPKEDVGRAKMSGFKTDSKEAERSDAGSWIAKDSLTAEKLLSRVSADSIKQSIVHEKKEQIKPASHWSAAILFAPEFSTTSLNSYSKPGESLGLRIGYQISNRFTVNVGLIRSTKKYECNGHEYAPPNPLYWQVRTNGMVPEEIDGQCLVYELPLDVQFNALQTAKSRVFIATGISSYFMMSQNYDYTFDYPNPGADMGWRSSRSEKYWFGVGVVSAGYERHISRTLALGIEPYLKVSLSDIGWPNIKLFSTGAYVTLRYKFMVKKNIIEQRN